MRRDWAGIITAFGLALAGWLVAALFWYDNRGLLELSEWYATELRISMAQVEVYERTAMKPSYFEWVRDNGYTAPERTVLKVSYPQNNVCVQCHEEEAK